jgi:hypothetical protein
MIRAAARLSLSSSPLPFSLFSLLQHLPSSQPSALIEAAQVDKHGLRDLKAFYPETFDYVLLDPPCSALGLRPRFALDVRG